MLIDNPTIGNATGTSLALGSTLNASTIFDVTSTTKGTRPIPSMTSTQRDAISSPATGLMIYNTTKTCFQFYNGSSFENIGVQTGEIITSASISTPTGYFLCDGTALDRTDYADLYNKITVSKGTFTITIASPGVVTLNSHGLLTGDNVELTTTGALPTGLTVNTNYFVIYVSANTFQLATSLANALAGTGINTSGTQSGTHTLRYTPYGISSISGFYIPDLRGAFARGAGTSTKFTTNAYTPLGSANNDRVQGHIHSDTIGVSTHPDHDHGSGTLAGQYYGRSADDAGTTYDGAVMYSYSTAGTISAGKDMVVINSGRTGAESPNLTHTITGAVGSPTTDGTNGTPRTGLDTRPQNIGVNYFIKF